MCQNIYVQAYICFLYGPLHKQFKYGNEKCCFTSNYDKLYGNSGHTQMVSASNPVRRNLPHLLENIALEIKGTIREELGTKSENHTLGTHTVVSSILTLGCLVRWQARLSTTRYFCLKCCHKNSAIGMGTWDNTWRHETVLF